jgi:PEP-CTERM motif
MEGGATVDFTPVPRGRTLASVLYLYPDSLFELRRCGWPVGWSPVKRKGPVVREWTSRVAGAALSLVLVAAAASSARASAFVVGEFSWSAEKRSQVGVPCDPGDTDCLSVFGLTNLLPDPGPSLSGSLFLDNALFDAFLPVPTTVNANFDQLSQEPDLPGVARVEVSLLVGGVNRTIVASLTQPGERTLYLEEAETVPEPGSALLLAAAAGAALVGTRRRRRPLSPGQ